MPFYADPNRFPAPVWQADPSQGMNTIFFYFNCLIVIKVKNSVYKIPELSNDIKHFQILLSE